jgi:hypothetical protein
MPDLKIADIVFTGFIGAFVTAFLFLSLREDLLPLRGR